jgi:hypothetical protein
MTSQHHEARINVLLTQSVTTETERVWTLVFSDKGNRGKLGHKERARFTFCEGVAGFSCSDIVRRRLLDTSN